MKKRITKKELLRQVRELKRKIEKLESLIALWLTNGVAE